MRLISLLLAAVCAYAKDLHLDGSNSIKYALVQSQTDVGSVVASVGHDGALILDYDTHRELRQVGARVSERKDGKKAFIYKNQFGDGTKHELSLDISGLLSDKKYYLSAYVETGNNSKLAWIDDLHTGRNSKPGVVPITFINPQIQAFGGDDDSGCVTTAECGNQVCDVVCQDCEGDYGETADDDATTLRTCDAALPYCSSTMGCVEECDANNGGTGDFTCDVDMPFCNTEGVCVECDGNYLSGSDVPCGQYSPVCLLGNCVECDGDRYAPGGTDFPCTDIHPICAGGSCRECDSDYLAGGTYACQNVFTTCVNGDCEYCSTFFTSTPACPDP